MTSFRVLLAVFVCAAAVHSSMQEQTVAKKREALLQLVQKLESSLKREALQDITKQDEELLKQERERQAELKREKQEEIKRKQIEEFQREARIKMNELRREAARKIKEKIEQEKRKREEKAQDEKKQLAEELAKMTEDEDENINKRKCTNRLKGKRCQLLRWFRKSCDSVQMKRDCKASCGKC